MGESWIIQYSWPQLIPHYTPIALHTIYTNKIVGYHLVISYIYIMMEHIRKNMILSTKLAILASICIIYLPDLPWRTIAMCIALRVRSHHPSMAAPVSEPSPMVSKVALSKASEKDFNHQKWGFPSQKSKFKMISKGLKNKHMAISRHGDFYRHIIRFDRQINRIPPNTLNKKICWVSLRHIYVYIYIYISIQPEEWGLKQPNFRKIGIRSLVPKWGFNS